MHYRPITMHHDAFKNKQRRLTVSCRDGACKRPNVSLCDSLVGHENDVRMGHGDVNE